MTSAASRETRLPLRDAPAEGTVRMIELEGHQIGLYTLAGAVYAIANRCPHRGAPLCAGKIATPIQTEADGIGLGQPNSILRCPWHKWEFDIATGRCLVDERLRVRSYPVEIDGNEIVVTLDRRPQTDQHRR